MRLAILKSAGRTDKLTGPAEVDVTALSPKAVWKLNSFLFGEPQSFLLGPSTDWVRLAHIMEGNWVGQSLLT